MTLAALFASSCTRCRPLSGDTSPPLMTPRQHLHEPESRWPPPTMMPSPPSDYLSPYCILASCRRQYAWNQIRFDSPHDDKAPPEPPGTCLVNHLASDFGHRAQNFIHRPPEILYTGQQNIFWTGHHKFYKHRTRSELAFTPHLFLCLLRARRQHPQKIEMIQQSYHLHLFCSRRMLWMIWGKCYGNHKPASQKGELSSNHLLHRSNPPAAKVQKSGSLWFFTF